MPHITLPDGSIREFDKPVSAAEVAASIGAGLAKAAIGAKVDGQLSDLSVMIDRDAELSLITALDRKSGESSADALYLIRHSAAHVMAEAIQRVIPSVQLVYGPPLDTGFYYDMYVPAERPIRADDFEKIEAEMAKIIAEDRPFTRYEMPADAGMKKLQTEGSKYKIDNARRAIEAGSDCLSWYITGAMSQAEIAITRPIGPPFFEDLCRGPHVPSTGKIGAFKVMSLASSYWHGDENSDRLTRVYGVAFADTKQLDRYLNMMEEAKKRDHRALGKQLRLFHVDETVGQGLILWTPNGSVVRQELMNFIGDELRKQGYHQVFTPHIGKLDLYRTSGHFPYYQDSQFPTMLEIRQEAKPLLELLQEARNQNRLPDPIQERQLVEAARILESEYPWTENNPLFRHAIVRTLSLSGPTANATCADICNAHSHQKMDGYLLKPMNCPHHIKIYDSQPHSYRDLPVRLAEFGTVYRWEQSGEVGGMTRVRGFTQDDAHLFCTEDQVAQELIGCLELVKVIFKTLGMHDYRVRVGKRDPDSSKYVGDPKNWDKAEAACREAASSLGVPFSEEAGEAAFYGPKIDFIVKDVVGREWQLGTVQVDYNLPQRFDLKYTGQDNQPHRPVMIHRAPFGSFERFIGVLIEHFAGAFPTWLAPEQVRVLPISEKTVAYANRVLAELKQMRVRATMDDSNERIQAKVKVATDMKIPFLLVVGPRDAEQQAVSVRAFGMAKDLGAIPLDAFTRTLSQEISTRGATTVLAEHFQEAGAAV